MPTCSQAQADIAETKKTEIKKSKTKTRIPRPCPPKPACKPARKVTPPKKNISPIRKPKDASTHAVMMTPRKSRKSTGNQTSIIVAEPVVTENNEIQAWRCFQCSRTKDFESSLALMFHNKYRHDRDFSCPVEGCKRGDFADWRSLLSNHIRLKHKALWSELQSFELDYNHQPFYEKLYLANRKFSEMMAVVCKTLLVQCRNFNFYFSIAF